MTPAPENRRVLAIAPGPGNPRNSEGDFVELSDGRICFIYSRFTSGRGGDHDPAFLAARFSSDGGISWSEKDATILPNEAGMNFMSVSLRRLPDGRIAMFHLVKNSLADCRPVVRFSDDEANSWSDAVQIITEEVDYYVLNNDRPVILPEGRIVVPAARHTYQGEQIAPGVATSFLSDDAGASWRRARSVIHLEGDPPHLQEPGIVELSDGRLMMFCRTRRGVQYLSFSADRGETWSKPEASTITSPCSPAGIKRIPSTGDLLLVWNDNFESDHPGAGKRTPLCSAISRDDGKSWECRKIVEDDPEGWYCYTAIHFSGEHALLGHCAGNRATGNGLAVTQITRLPVSWLYE